MLEPRRLMAVLTVNSFADILNPSGGTVTLRSAIAAANASLGADTIDINVAGTYKIGTSSSSTDNSAGELSIFDAGDLTIQNTSGGVVTIDGGGLGRVFAVNPAGSTKPFNVTFQGLVISGGLPQLGGGGAIDANGATTVILNQCQVRDNGTTTGNGGGIAMEAGSTGALVLNGTQVLQNVAGGDTNGGGIVSFGSGPVDINAQSTVTENIATGTSGGGGIYVNGAPLNITGAVISGNRSFGIAGTPGTGGGIENGGSGPVTIFGSLIQDNTASGNGGGYADTGAGSLSVVNSFILNNDSGLCGGGLFAGGPTITLTNTTLGDNTASQSGGGGDFTGTGAVTVTDGTIIGNLAVSFGGGIDNTVRELTVIGTTFDSNRDFSGNGGGLYSVIGIGSATILNSLFRDNVAGFEGGGLSASGGTFALINSRLTGNSAHDAAGAAVTSAFTIKDTTFDGNVASQGCIVNLGLVSGGNVINSTIAGNRTSGAAAVSLFGVSNGVLTMAGDTIDGNANASVTGGGGVEQGVDALVVEDTIIAGNTSAGAPADFLFNGGTMTDNGGNLISTAAGDGGKFGPGTMVGNPRLGPLVDNGGALAGSPSTSQVVPTQALLPGSPAFGKGIAVAGLTTDERNFARAAKLSIGAYEPQYAANATANQIFVETAYEVLFNQVADPAGFANATSFLNNGGTPTALVQILQPAMPYLDNETVQIYRRYLDRAPSTAELNIVANLLSTGTTPEQIAAALISSPEFTSDYGKGESDVFVEAAFVTTLSRPTASQAELTAWDGALASGVSHAMVSSLLLTSTEYLTDLTLVDFDAYDGWPPTTTDLTAFLGAAKAGVTSPNLAAIAFGSSFATRT
jgi:CSLREA domain-containing protein